MIRTDTTSRPKGTMGVRTYATILLGQLRVGLSIVAPVLILLIVSKLVKLGYTNVVVLSRGPENGSYWDLLKWAVADFASITLFLPICVGGCFWRFTRSHRLPKSLAAMGVAWLILITFQSRLTKTPLLPAALGWQWGLRQEARLFLACIWREILTMAFLLFLVAGINGLTKARLNAIIMSLCKGGMVVTCLMLGLDLAYFLTMGQRLTGTVIQFTLASFSDTLPVLSSELSLGRISIVVIPLVSSLVWYRLYAIPRVPPSRGASWISISVAATSLLLLTIPPYKTGKVAFERMTEGTLIAFCRSVFSTSTWAAARNTDAAFRKTGRPRWHSADMRFVETTGAQRRNVIVMVLESFRADSVTRQGGLHDTTPFLASLQDKSLFVEDMQAVIPRTVGAWMAILGGQYPLTNEGNRIWSPKNRAHPRVKGLASVLRENGYAAAFFEPTVAGKWNENDVIDALGFEEVYSEKDFATPQTKWVNYMGLADEVMIEPITEWIRKRTAEHKPFLLSITTNVGHHVYQTPESWKQREFPGVKDPSFHAYLNCLSYIDSVLQRMFDNFSRLGILDNTIFVIVGDHGSPFGEHGVRKTNTLHVEGVHVPALIYAPAIPISPRIIHGVRQQIDILPTIAELLNYEIVDASLPGRSLLSPVDPERILYMTGIFEDSSLAMQRGRYKFIYEFGGIETQVYDIEADRDERMPLTGIAKSEVTAAEAAMLEWQSTAKLSMFARPDPRNPGGPWLRQ